MSTTVPVEPESATQADTSRATTRRTEIIAIASGKGGTGKTLLGACLGYALIYSGHRVLMIDTDTATHGLSLYLLGPDGTDLQPTRMECTWAAVLSSAGREGSWKPAVIRRDIGGESDHGLKYETLISELGLYGEDVGGSPPPPGHSGFSQATAAFFAQLRSANEYDYVLVDTRGGFSFETTDVCALADSFIAVTDSDVTSFVQNRNLIRRINLAGGELETRPLLRAFIVNRADGDEQLFRIALTREFNVKFPQTYPIPLDLEAVKAYKTQKSPFVAAPSSHFTYATLDAFRGILSVVTAEWGDEQVTRWRDLNARVSKAVEDRNAQFAAKEAEDKRQSESYAALAQEVTEQKGTIEHLERELTRITAAHEREIQRVDAMRSSPSPAPRGGQARAGLLRWVVVGGVVAALAVLAPFAMNFKRGATTENELVSLYKQDTPPALRVGYLKDLLARGVKSFDQINLAGMVLEGIAARGISLHGATLDRASLRGSDLSRANLSSTSLLNANLSRVNLSEANLSGANLSQADLSGAELGEADLSNANITRALVAWGQLREAARLDGVTGLVIKGTVAEASHDRLLVRPTGVAGQEGHGIGDTVTIYISLDTRYTEEAREFPVKAGQAVLVDSHVEGRRVVADLLAKGSIRP